MAFSVEFRDRGNNAVRANDGLAWEVGRYSARAVGGCDTAELTVRGERGMLEGLRGWLLYPVTIRNDNGNAVWWGFVAAVDVNLGGLGNGVDVEKVRNRVSVAYTERAADGGQVRGTTPWAEDADSQALYGIHEERLSMGDTTEAVVLSRRDAYLGMRRKPVPTPPVVGGEAGATLRCLGMWHMLDWRYWAQPAGFEAFAGATKTEHVISFELTSTELGFKTPDKLIDMLGRLHVLTAGTRLGVYGSANNDNIYSVKSAPKTPDDDAVAYASSLIWFDPADDIYDVNNGLDAFKSGDLIKISGSGSNSGYRKVNTAGTDHMEVNPKTIVHEDAGPSVTIRRGHDLQINEAFYESAYPGPSILLFSVGTKVGQSFTPSYNTPWNAYEVVVQARRIGAPVDALRVGIWSNSGGVPNALLASGTVAGTALSEEMAAVSVTLSAPLALAYGTTYWVVVERTGAASATAMYAVGMDEGLGHSGAMKIWKVDHWEDRVPNCDMPFEVWGQRETTAQIADMVGYVLPRVVVESPSGVYARQWRAGEQTVRQEAEELLAAGTSAGKRLLAQVSPEGVARIFAEPEPSSLDWQLGIDGKFKLPLGALDEGQLPVGQWVQMEAEAAQFGPQFLEHVAYTPGSEGQAGSYQEIEWRSSAPWEAWT